MEYFDYKGKVCVVTGAASGIGKSVTELLVEMGAEVYAMDVITAEIKGIKQFIHCDLSLITDIDSAFNEIPKNIDCFFGIAGLSGFKTDYKKTFDVNFTSNKYITEKYLRWRMKYGASILFVTSTAGLNWLKYKSEQDKFVHAKDLSELEKNVKDLAKFSPASFAYIFSKRCMSQYISEQAIEYGKIGIRMNNVMPGPTNTGLTSEFEYMIGGKEQLIAEAGVAKRLAEPEEIAYPCLFLNSKMASFIVGEELCIDFADNNLKKLGIKKDKEDISATNKFVLMMAKKAMDK